METRKPLDFKQIIPGDEVTIKFSAVGGMLDGKELTGTVKARIDEMLRLSFENGGSVLIHQSEIINHKPKRI